MIASIKYKYKNENEPVTCWFIYFDISEKMSAHFTLSPASFQKPKMNEPVNCTAYLTLQDSVD